MQPEYQLYYEGVLRYRRCITQLYIQDPERWGPRLKSNPFDMRAIFVWLYVSITSKTSITLKQTRTKLKNMSVKPEYEELRREFEVSIYHPPSVAPTRRFKASGYDPTSQEFRLHYRVVDDGVSSPWLIPFADPQPPDMLPKSTYSVRMAGPKVAGAHIYLQSPWCFITDCRLVISSSDRCDTRVQILESSTVGDAAERTSMCTLPVEVISQVLKTSRHVSLALFFTIRSPYILLNNVLKEVFPSMRDITRVVIELEVPQLHVLPSASQSFPPSPSLALASHGISDRRLLSSDHYPLACNAKTSTETTVAGPFSSPSEAGRYDLSTEQGRRHVFTTILDEILRRTGPL
ncbi:hypothetical protein NMY22_g1349 [Coprinellus aureogranulatus]|nr:hypothetical protein NMY22_g1349 [Coprinellus aureogranulatus]